MGREQYHRSFPFLFLLNIFWLGGEKMKDLFRLTILLVDDEPSIVECWKRLFQNFLENDENFFLAAIITATSGISALELFKAYGNNGNSKLAPNIIFSDVQMPEMDGDVMISKIRSLGFDPVVFFYDGGQKEKLCCNYDERFTKPVISYVVLNNIRNILVDKFLIQAQPPLPVPA